MARRRPPPPDATGVVPPELRSRTHPIWHDPDAVRARFPEYYPVNPSRIDLEHRLHALVLRSWAAAEGFTREDYPGMLDWHRLRAVGYQSLP